MKAPKLDYLLRMCVRVLVCAVSACGVSNSSCISIIAIYISTAKCHAIYTKLNQEKKVLEGQSNEIRKDVIGCDIVYTSPDRLNIFYAVKERTTIDEDLQFGINDLKINNLEWLCTADP